MLPNSFSDIQRLPSFRRWCISRVKIKKEEKSRGTLLGQSEEKMNESEEKFKFEQKGRNNRLKLDLRVFQPAASILICVPSP